MAVETSQNDRIRSVLVMLATAGMIAFNALAATGYVNGITPREISDRYPTVLTPAGYAFSIWTLIYFGLAIFSVPNRGNLLDSGVDLRSSALARRSV